MIEIKFPENIHTLTEHIIYVIYKNPGIQRQGFDFNGFTKSSISNYVCKLAKRGLITNEKGLLNLTLKGKAANRKAMKQPIPTMQLAEKILRTIAKDALTITQIALKLFPDESRNSREKPVRLAMARLQRDNKVINTKPVPGNCAVYKKGSIMRASKIVRDPKAKMNDLFILGSITKQREII